MGRESIKQFHHFAQLLLQLTRTLTVDASPVLLPKSVARRERGGGIKLLLQLIICQRLVATTAAVWFSVLVVSNDQIIIIKKMGLGGERENKKRIPRVYFCVCAKVNDLSGWIG